jgi:hypothetical protein
MPCIWVEKLTLDSLMPFLFLSPFRNRIESLSERSFCAFVVLAGRLLHHGLNPTDLHARDFVALLAGNAPESALFSCLWATQRIIDFSEDARHEPSDKRIGGFAALYDRTTYSVKVELVLLILPMTRKVSDEQLVRFFTDHVDLLMNFLGARGP